MAHTTCEMMWIKSLMSELCFDHPDPMLMYCDNRTAICIASNPVFRERTKHIEVDCHFVRDAVMNNVIRTPFTPSSKQLADILTKSVPSDIFNSV